MPQNYEKLPVSELAERLVKAGVTTREAMYEALKMNGKQADIINLWIAWTEKINYNRGFQAGRDYLAMEIRDLLKIPE